MFRQTIRYQLALLLLLCGVLNITLADTKAEAGTKYILVTGFEPFGGELKNGSWEAVQHLQEAVFENKKVIVYQLPVVWEKASEKLQALIQEYHPVAVVSFGEAGAEPVRLELVAKNVRESFQDNIGHLPRTGFISASAPPELYTALNIDLIIQHLREASIPVVLSRDAGGYLCNETFFSLMNFHENNKPLTIRRGFVHVPPLNAQVVVQGKDTMLFDKATLEKTADIVVRTVAADL